MIAATHPDRVRVVRRFNRFYTKRIGVLEERLLQSDLSLAEARVVYELAQKPGTTATYLSQELALDPGYLSRLLARLERQGLITKCPSPEDRRQRLLSLTDHGQTTFGKLDHASGEQISTMLGEMSEEDQARLVVAMETVEGLLSAPAIAPEPYVLRQHEAGDMGWIVHRHGRLYGQEYNWDHDFEALVAEIVAQFLRNHDPRVERCWIAERDGENVGSVFLSKKSDDVAQLRLLLVEPSARGLGIGKRLVAECTRFARRVGYRKIMLWTNSVLHAARHIYELEGYCLVKEEAHHSFGHDLVGQTWELEL